MVQKAEFIRSIHERRKVRVSFFSKEDGSVITRKCAPMDFGPSRVADQKNDRFHVWDYESDTKPHSMSLNPEQIESIVVLDERFDPAEFVSWTPKWIVPRDWGAYS